MSLADVVRSAVAVADRVSKPLQPEVTFAPWISESGFGDVEYREPFGDPIPINAIVEQKQRLKLVNGQQVMTMAHLVILTPIADTDVPDRVNPIDPRDRFVLPDGTTGPIVDISGLIDKDTKRPFFAEVWIGSLTQVKQGY